MGDAGARDLVVAVCVRVAAFGEVPAPLSGCGLAVSGFAGWDSLGGAAVSFSGARSGAFGFAGCDFASGFAGCDFASGFAGWDLASGFAESAAASVLVASDVLADAAFAASGPAGCAAVVDVLSLELSPVLGGADCDPLPNLIFDTVCRPSAVATARYA
jgi:hypothetical protein